jgi:hypothetical protein
MVAGDRVPLWAIDMYSERQVDEECALHALNMLFGRAICSGSAVISFLSTTWPEGSIVRRIRANSQEYTFPAEYDRGGPFSVRSVNRWLYSHCHPHVTLVLAAEGCRPGCVGSEFTACPSYSFAELRERLPPSCDRLYFWYLYRQCKY